MKNRLLFIVVVVLAVIYGNMGSTKESTSHILLKEENTPVIQNKSSKVVIKDMAASKYSTLEMEDYLVGVVAGEMPASFNYEALKAQAVAARSYAYNKIETSNGDYDLTTDASNQVYITIDEMKNRWKDSFDYYYHIVKNAVDSTKGEVITYDNKVVPAYYFAMGNGTTEDSLYAFGNEQGYLKSVDSFENINDKNYIVTNVFTREEFCESLGIDCTNGINIQNITESNTNRITNITINSKTFTGTVFKYALGLRSNDAYINVKDNVYITTCGWGHGVGMSQYGANNMANQGYNYKEILSHYYTDIDIKNINSII